MSSIRSSRRSLRPLRPDAVATPPTPEHEPESKPPPNRAKVEPLSPSRYKVQFTASAAFREKLERLQALLRTTVADGDLAAVVEIAVTEKLERLEARRYAKTDRERKSVEQAAQADPIGSSRYIPASVKRIVRKRDGDRCTFVDGAGRRCPERHVLEFHHRDPWARGGDRSPGNLALMCKTHNAYLADLEYGRSKMQRYRAKGSMVRESPALYLPGSSARSRFRGSSLEADRPCNTT